MSEVLASATVWLSGSLPAELSTAGFALGIFTILISLRTKFDIIAGEDIPQELRIFRLRELTSARKYRLGLTIYFLFILSAYSFIVLALSRIEISQVSFLDLGDVDLGKNPDSLALYVALAFSGIIPNVKYLSTVEYGFRNLGQRYSGIPTDHNRIFEKIQLSDVKAEITDKDIGISLLKREIEPVKKLVGNDTLEELRKCKLILSRLTNSDRNNIEFDLVTVRVKELFDTVLDSIREKVEQSQTHLKGLVAVDHGESGGPIASKVERDIRGWFRALSYMLGCAIIADAKVKVSNLTDILNEFGFEAKEAVRSDLLDRFHRAVFYAFCGQIAINVAVFYGVSILNLPYRLLPNGLINSLTLVATPFIGTVICTKVYLAFRERRISNNSWFSGSQRVRISALLVAAGLSSLSLLSIPYFELILRFTEADQFYKWTFHETPREYLTVFAHFFSYPVSYTIVLMIFAEVERKAAHDTRYRNKLYAKSITAYRTAFIFAIFLISSLLLSDASSRFIVENPTYLIPDDILAEIDLADTKDDLAASRPIFIGFMALQSAVTALIFCGSYVLMTLDRKYK